MTVQEFQLNTEITNPEELIGIFFRLYPDFSAEEQSRIYSSWMYLYSLTKNMTRFCGKAYYLHPMRVAAILAENHLDADSIIAGFFHNILEIENADAEEIQNKLGKSVYGIISGTAKITALHINTKTLAQADSIRKMLFAMIDDIRVILVKLADRLDRMRHLKLVSPEAQRAVAQEVIDVWAPLANRLGMSSVKTELEDLSLKFSNPEVFRQLKRLVDMKKNERAEYLEKAQKDIYRAASRVGIDITVTSRAKHFYSIYQKMRKRNKAAEELYDLLAMRIICESETECYTLVGLVHNLWKPLDGRFKDYIVMPKANGYQSLHTTVMCCGKPLEIQIRTRKMHEVAELGVASHWLYKKGTNHDAVDAGNLSIINQLRELRQEHLNDDDFFNEIKDELLGDSIFVFTPKGDVRELPAGATAVDFAYSIHSRIGETISGAKANGHIIPLSRPLKNTQIIEILTSPQSHPTENQLRFVKTARAKSKIRAWLAAHDSVSAEKNLSAAVSANSAAAAEESVQKNTHHSSGDYISDKNHADVHDTAAETQHVSARIRIGDTTNFLVTKARCCNPVYGNDIVGYVSRGRGIVVHCTDCRNFLCIPNVAARTIALTWEPPAGTENAQKSSRQKKQV
ncbi:MAG: RelA/SpoT family protein [Bacteroides sp.]|nr:RelA/SpoT family protein [Prevotella sp.]MCM1407670.1 RelA/SpoT family protein [Treponema brennaborense]MCM1469180.1 RelA/SpoT family protein [Bacteroides sp.]